MTEPKAVISRRLALQLGALASAAILSPMPSPARTIRRSIAAKPAARPYPYAKPYTLTSQSQLSQDFFSTTEILLAPTDEVFPYTDANGVPAALVLSGDTASIVLPDRSQPSGYSYQALSFPPPPNYVDNPLGAPTIRSLAVGNDGAGATYVMVGWSVQAYPVSRYPRGQLDTVFVWGRLDGATFTSLGEIDTWVGAFGAPYPYPVPTIPIRLIINSAGTLRFAVFLADDTFMTVLPANGTTEYRTMPSATGIRDGWVCELNGGYYTAAVDQTNDVICADPTGQQFHQINANNPAASLGDDGVIAGFAPATADDSVTGPAVGLVVYGPNAPGSSDPGASLAVFLLADGTSSYLPINASYPSLSSVVLLPRPAGWHIASVAGGELQMALQLQPLDRYKYGISAAVPFQKGIDRVWVAQSPDPDATTFFVERSDSSLALLVQSAATHSWNLTPIRRAADTVQDVSMWRTHLTVRDANGIAVPNLALSVTAESEIAIWQNNSSALVGPDDPVTLTTNALGQIVFATPAIALHTPAMTFSGGGVAPTVISPDGDVHAYLAGTGSLDPAGAGSASGMLDAATFAQATVTDANGNSKPLAPAVYGGGTDSSSPSAAIATTINMAVVAGLAASSTTVSTKNLPSNLSLDFTGGTPKYTQKFAGSTTNTTRVTDIFDDIESAADEVADAAKAAYDDAVSLLNNAVGSAINSCEKVGIAAVEGTQNYAVEITCLVADDVVTTISYVIADVKTALAAVTAILKTIGAELDDIIMWLRALLGGLIKDAWDAAVEIDGLLNALPAKFEAGVKPIVGKISSGMDYAKTKVDGVFDTLLTEVNGSGSSLGGSTQMMAGGGPFIGNDAADIIPKIFENPQAAWVFSKFTDEIVDVSFVVPPNLEKQLAAVVAAMGTQALAAATSAGTSVANTLVKFTDSDPTKVGEYALGELLTLFKDAFDLAAAFSEDVFDAIVDLLLGVVQSIDQTLNTPISSDLGFIGDVLSFLGIDVSLTLQRLLCLVVAFPAAVIVDLGTSAGSLFDSVAPTGPAGTDRLAAAPAPVADKILTVSYAIADLVGTLCAVVADGYQAQEDNAPAAYQILGIGTSLIEQAISWPGKDGLADPTFQPYENGILDLDLQGSWSLWCWLGGYCPVLIEVLSSIVAKIDPDGDGGVSGNLGSIRDPWYATAGAALTLTSVLTAVDGSATSKHAAPEIVLASTEWVTTAFAFLANQQVVDATETISLYIKLALDALLGVVDAGAVLFELTN